MVVRMGQTQEENVIKLMPIWRVDAYCAAPTSQVCGLVHKTMGAAVVMHVIRNWRVCPLPGIYQHEIKVQ